MRDHDLDRAIDVVVREMTRVESSVDVKTQVLQRLGRTEHHVFTWTRLAVTAAVGLLLVFALWRASRPTPVMEMTTTPPIPAPIASSPDIPASTAHSTPPLLEAARGPSNEFDRWSIAQREAEPAPTVPPLTPLDPLVVTAAQPPDIEPDAIVIAPLPDVPDVRVEPLSPASGPQ